MRHAVSAAAVALLLASCSGQEKAGNDSAATGAASKAAGTETASAAGGADGSGAASFQPGQWEVRAEVRRISMPNMPAGATPPMPPATTISFCMTPEQARRPDANSLTANARESGCNYRNFSMGNGRISGSVQCDTGGAQMQTTLDGRFTATSYDINQRAQVTTSGVSTDMEAHMTGRRTGECTAGAR